MNIKFGGSLDLADGGTMEWEGEIDASLPTPAVGDMVQFDDVLTDHEEHPDCREFQVERRIWQLDADGSPKELYLWLTETPVETTRATHRRQASEMMHNIRNAKHLTTA